MGRMFWVLLTLYVSESMAYTMFLNINHDILFSSAENNRLHIFFMLKWSTFRSLYLTLYTNVILYNETSQKCYNKRYEILCRTLELNYFLWDVR